MNLLEAMKDEKLFGPWFKDADTWAAWRAFVGALFGLPLSESETTTYRACTGRSEAPEAAGSEVWLICGRRAGKSFVLALIAVYLATFRDYRQYLAPGERATILIIATDRRQARVIFRYVKGLLTQVPMLARMIERETSDEFDLSNRVTIEVGTSSYRAVRGRTLAAALCDEISFWPSDTSANPDYEILDALRPAMATIPNGMLLCASSPYSRKGALYDAHKRHYGRNDSPVLVWQAATRTMNPSVPQRVIDDAMERDPASASAEYLAQFRSDIESFITIEAVQACVPNGVREVPPVTGQRYSAFVDVSGGGADSSCLAIAHQDGDLAVLDAVREIKGGSPDAVAAEFAALCKTYRVTTVVGDNYGAAWVRERFASHGVTYKPSDKNKSDIYREFLPILNSQRCKLLDVPKLEAQLISLERRTTRGTGKDIIDHPQVKNAHDDLANAAAGAIVEVNCGPRPLIITREFAEWAKQPTEYSRRRNPFGMHPFGRGF